MTKFLLVMKDIEFYRNTQELLQQNTVHDNFWIQYVFLFAFLLTLVVSVVLWRISKMKSKQYSKIINTLSGELKRQKFQADSFGLVLNAEIVPICLIDSEGKILWANQAFLDFYGKEIKIFDFLWGTSADLDKEKIKTTKIPETFFVKMKNFDGKTSGFTRTLIPINTEAVDGKNYAIIENILN